MCLILQLANRMTAGWTTKQTDGREVILWCQDVYTAYSDMLPTSER